VFLVKGKIEDKLEKRKEQREQLKELLPEFSNKRKQDFNTRRPPTRSRLLVFKLFSFLSESLPLANFC
jgi:hypothetical protein